ncbi:unnamed protein product [Prunus brigantina]
MMKSRLQNAKAFSLLPKSSIHNTNYLRRSHCSPSFINILSRHHVRKQNYSMVIHATSSKFRPSSEATSKENKAVTIKAVVKVQVTAGGFISTIGLTRPLVEFTDLVGKTLFLELVSTQLDLILYLFMKLLQTGLEETIKGYANKASQKDDEVIYESNFSIPAGFGELGAVEVENEHHKEIFIKSIHLHGFPNGSVNVPCNSWTHSKFDNLQKRIFFTNKSFSPISLARFVTIYSLILHIPLG